MTEKMHKVNIRAANMRTDALSIVDGARDFAIRMGLTHMFPEDEESFIKAISRVVTMDSVSIIIADDGGRIVGGIGLLYGPYAWNPDQLSADELFWWTAQDAPIRTASRLLKHALNEIDERGALSMFRALENSPKGVDRTYKRCGFVPVETMYMRMPWR